MVDKHNSFVQQQMSTELTHHGVKGMKWGVRKQDFKLAPKGTNSKSFRKRSVKEKVYTGGRIATGAVGAKLASRIIGNAAGMTVSALGGSPQLASGVAQWGNIIGAYGGYKYSSALYKNNTTGWKSRGTTESRRNK